MSPIRILIADDHEVIRAGLKAIFRGTEFVVVAEAATGEAAVQLARDAEPDLALLDIRMPRGDGLYALDRIKSEQPELPCVMLSTHDHESFIVRSRELGASAFIRKGAAKTQLLETIRHAASRNGTCHPPALDNGNGATRGRENGDRRVSDG